MRQSLEGDKQRNNWIPATGALFQPADGKGGIGLQFWQASRRTLPYGVRNLGPTADTPYKVGTLPADQPFRFAVCLTDSGRLEIRVNDAVLVFGEAGLRPTKPILMCSGGHFLFQDLTMPVAPRS